MREILFRGRSKKTGGHVFGDVHHKGNCVVISWCDENGEYQEEEVGPETVEQFTGVCDMYGEKIFEGDTVGYETFDKLNGEPEPYSVYFCNGKFIISECPFYEAPDNISRYRYDDVDESCWILATEHC